jgi:SSS family solute:Na+ symporter
MRRLLCPCLTLALLCAAGCALAGEWPRELRSYQGATPTLDGVISPGEYDDATRFTGVRDWTPEFTPTTDDADLSLVGYVKHDAQRLYFAFDVTDDVLYAIDIPRWLPAKFPHAHDLTQQGFPWFGDEMELLINASNTWGENDGAAGDGSSWQMVCNLTKSRLGGIGVGGLLEGEPRVKDSAWNTYQRWILTGAQEAVAKVKPGGHGYVIEWAVKFDPCLELAPGRFYRADLPDTPVGLNIALGDLDEMERGEGNFANFHHEDWWPGEKDKRTLLRQFGTLWLMHGPRPEQP